MSAVILRRKEGLYLAYFFGNTAFMFEITRLTSEGMKIPFCYTFGDKL